MSGREQAPGGGMVGAGRATHSGCLGYGVVSFWLLFYCLSRLLNSISGAMVLLLLILVHAGSPALGGGGNGGHRASIPESQQCHSLPHPSPCRRLRWQPSLANSSPPVAYRLATGCSIAMPIPTGCSGSSPVSRPGRWQTLGSGMMEGWTNGGMEKPGEAVGRMEWRNNGMTERPARPFRHSTIPAHLPLPALHYSTRPLPPSPTPDWFSTRPGRWR